jgi:hypothetical protein
VVLISNNSKERGFEKLDVIKKYFQKIFTVMSKDVREQLMDLNLSKGELKEVKKELVFLPDEKQKEYLNELSKKK